MIVLRSAGGGGVSGCVSLAKHPAGIVRRKGQLRCHCLVTGQRDLMISLAQLATRRMRPGAAKWLGSSVPFRDILKLGSIQKSQCSDTSIKQGPW